MDLFFGISKNIAKGFCSAGIGMVYVQKVRTLPTFRGAGATFCGDPLGRCAKTREAS